MVSAMKAQLLDNGLAYTPCSSSNSENGHDGCRKWCRDVLLGRTMMRDGGKCFIWLQRRAFISHISHAFSRVRDESLQVPLI